jgi:hypothetical protein
MKTLSKLLLIILLATSGLAVHGQNSELKRLKVKKSKVYYDGQLFLEIPRQGIVCRVCAPGNNRTLITARWDVYNNPQHRNSGNPNGNVYYIELRFSGVEERAEIPHTRGGIRKILAMAVIDYELMVGDQLNIENVNDFIGLTGTPFTEEKSRIQIIEHH